MLPVILQHMVDQSQVAAAQQYATAAAVPFSLAQRQLAFEDLQQQQTQQQAGSTIVSQPQTVSPSLTSAGVSTAPDAGQFKIESPQAQSASAVSANVTLVNNGTIGPEQPQPSASNVSAASFAEPYFSWILPPNKCDY